MNLNKIYTYLLVTIFGIFLYTYHKTIIALCIPTIHCDLDFEALVNYIIMWMRTFDLHELIVILSNLEHLQDLVGVPQNGYDINNVDIFFGMLFQAQDLSVELIDGVYLNVIIVDNITYTVDPDFISFLIYLFITLEFIFF